MFIRPHISQGATQAIEDAATIAITLELAGKPQVPLALRTMEKMRYTIVNDAQFSFIRASHEHSDTNDARLDMKWALKHAMSGLKRTGKK